MSQMKILVLGLALVLLAPGDARAQSDTLPLIRMLFIGNSYTYFNDLPRTLQTLALRREKPVAIEVTTVWQGGQSLKGHWNDSAAVRMIRQGYWDYVVLQEQSLLPIRMPDTLIAYGKRFDAEVKAAGARTMLYLTWPRKGRASAQDSLTRPFRQLATEVGALIVPVGPAWLEVQKIDSTLELYFSDQSHPSPMGTYVAAVTFYRMIFNELPSTHDAIAYRATPSLTGPFNRVVPIRVPRGVAQSINQAVTYALLQGR